MVGIDSATLLGAAPGALTGFVQLSAGSPGVLIPIGVPDRDDGPYLSYALQWCVFGAVALLSVGFFAYRETSVPYPGETSANELLSPAAARGPAANPTAVVASPHLRAKFVKSDLYD